MLISIIGVPVEAPLANIAAHVMKFPSVRLPSPNRTWANRVFDIPQRPTMGVAGFKGKVVSRGGPSSAGVFPFGFR